MPVGNGVGRGISSMPADVEAVPLEAPAVLVRRREVPRDQRGTVDAAARQAPPASATMIAATLPWPPISPTNRPPGRSARATPAITASGSALIQCRAAFENTASNSARERQGCAVDEPRVDAAVAALRAPCRARRRRRPPRSRARPAAAAARRRRSRGRGCARPGCGASNSTTGSTQLGDEPGMGGVARGLPVLAVGMAELAQLFSYL